MTEQSTQHPDQSSAPVPPDFRAMYFRALHFRALCAELVEELHKQTCLYEGYETALVSRAHAALAEPAACDYPNCVDDSPDERCSRWLTGECQGPDSRAALAQPVPPDFRALCAELADVLQGRKDLEYGWPGDDLEQDLIDRARTALTQPVPVSEKLPPKIGHIFQLARIIQECCEECTDKEAVTLARSILEHPESRWGNTTPKPVPVSERLPGPEDCDEQALTIQKLLALVEDLEGALLSAADSLEEWGGYVEPYFKAKHAFDADVANARSHAQRARNVINGDDIIGEIDD